jgi:hypothetical protein
MKLISIINLIINIIRYDADFLQDNATLWRLYYYVEAVEKAKSLSCCEEA